MRAVVQRVSEASVIVDDRVVGAIERGLLVYLGIEREDRMADLIYMADKIPGLRIFNDSDGVMNLPLDSVEKGSLLVVSQFTLCADTRKGRRPSYNNAAEPEKGKEYYLKFVQMLKDKGFPVETGIFQAHMDVRSVNDGPVTILVDSRKQF